MPNILKQEYLNAEEQEHLSVEEEKNYTTHSHDFDPSKSVEESESTGKKVTLNWLQIAEKIAIPLGSIILGLILGLTQHVSDIKRGKIADENRYHAVIADYFDEMTDLQIGKDLEGHLPDELTQSITPEEKKASDIARARTLNTVRQLDGERKGQLLRFLYESSLIGGQCQFDPRTLMSENCQPRVLDLSSARLDGTKLEPPMPLQGIDLSGVLLTEAELPGIDLSEAMMPRINLVKANLTGTRLRDAEMEQADLRDAKLTEAVLLDANLRAANLSGANLQGANLRNADLTEADLTKADLAGTHFRDAEMKSADLRDAILVKAVLFGTYLSRANLQGADLRNADLTEADLQGANLEGAFYNEETKFPEAFSVNEQGMRLCTIPIQEECS